MCKCVGCRLCAKILPDDHDDAHDADDVDDVDVCVCTCEVVTVPSASVCVCASVQWLQCQVLAVSYTHLRAHETSAHL
eukprot:8643659-Alexandrium_andersonii.AAC.1